MVSCGLPWEVQPFLAETDVTVRHSKFFFLFECHYSMFQDLAKSGLWTPGQACTVMQLGTQDTVTWLRICMGTQDRGCGWLCDTRDMGTWCGNLGMRWRGYGNLMLGMQGQQEKKVKIFCASLTPFFRRALSLLPCRGIISQPTLLWQGLHLAFCYIKENHIENLLL